MIDDPLLGHRLANFRIDRVIARGGMAQVYLGWDVKLQRPVAIKVIDARYRDRPEFARRFVHEARAVATWRHENIVQIYYADDQDGLYYYVMEFVDGLDLSRLLRQYRDDGELMPYADVLRLGEAVAAALDYVHDKGVVHRDVKPSNVIVAGNGRVLLADFGLALDLQEGSQGEIFGSPHYMSPEQARRSSAAVSQSDLYSLGVILYELLTGVTPFDDPSPTTLALQHMTQPPPLPSTLNPALSPAVDTVLLRALAKDPRERFPTGAALMATLADTLGVNPAPQGMTLPTTRPISTLTVAERVAEHLESETVVAPPRPSTADPPVPTGWLWGGGVILLVFVTWLALFMGANGPAAGVSFTATPPEAVGALGGRFGRGEPAPGAAPAGTRTPTAVPTAVPSPTPSPLPTATTTARPSPTPSATPSPTITREGRIVRLLYNDASFYVLNRSERSFSVELLTFEALGTDSAADYFFNGRRWSGIFPRLEAQFCNSLTVAGGLWLEPFQCDGYNAVILISPVSPDLFWREREGISQFRVFWIGEEVARCEIRPGICDVYLPLP